MQWNSEMNAGFNILSNTTWLPVHPDYETINVEVHNIQHSTDKRADRGLFLNCLTIPLVSINSSQVQKNNESSVLSQYRFLNSLRQSELPFLRGWFCYVLSDTNVFSYLRELDGHKEAYLIVINFGKGSATTDLSAVQELPEQLKVLLSTNPANDEKVFQKSRIVTEPGEGLVIRYSTYTRFHPNHPAECYVSEKACYLETVDILYQC